MHLYDPDVFFCINCTIQWYIDLAINNIEHKEMLINNKIDELATKYKNNKLKRALHKRNNKGIHAGSDGVKLSKKKISMFIKAHNK